MMSGLATKTCPRTSAAFNQWLQVPPADEASLAGLEYSDRQRLMKERSEAAGIDRGHAKVCHPQYHASITINLDKSV